MPTCIVPGCTSGYRSNPEHVHFFTIPKNPESEKLWKAAISRSDDDAVKAGRSVCEKHFLKQQIAWKRQLLDPDGRVLGVSEYKVPRLISGSIPSVFPCNETTKAIAVESSVKLENDNNMSVEKQSMVGSAGPKEISTPAVKAQKPDASNGKIKVLASGKILTPIPIDKVPFKVLAATNPGLANNTLRLSKLAAAKPDAARVPQPVKILPATSPSLEKNPLRLARIAATKPDVSRVIQPMKVLAATNSGPEKNPPRLSKLAATNPDTARVPQAIKVYAAVNPGNVKDPLRLTKSVAAINSVSARVSRQSTVCTATKAREPKTAAIERLGKSANHARDPLELTEFSPANLDNANVPLQLAELSRINFFLPAGWITKNSQCQGSELFILLTHTSLKIQEYFQTFVSKAVTVTQDLRVQISVYGQPLKPEGLNLPDRVASIEGLQELIFTIDRHNICSGCDESSLGQEIEKLHGSNLRKDFTGSWRHTSCIWLLPHDSVCPFCLTAKKNLTRKISRWKQTESKYRNVEELVLEEKRIKRLILRNKYRKAIREMRESGEKIKTLKSELQHILSQKS